MVISESDSGYLSRPCSQHYGRVAHLSVVARNWQSSVLPICLAIVTALQANAVTIDKRVRAFPTAEGFGAYACGGRGGRVIFVTNLADYDPELESSIPGSFRAACLEKGPRIVLFNVSGTIELKATLEISEPYLTIAGQTAPGDGICIKNFTTIFQNTHDIIVRYMRFRPGDQLGRELQESNCSNHETDAMSVNRSSDVIFDHCSASWANDEVSSITRCDKVTVQWCFITESLHDSTHHKGPHGYGGLVVTYNTESRVTHHHNLWAFHSARSPRPGTEIDGIGLLYDFRNNLIYKGGRGYSVEGRDKIRMNYIGNVIIDSEPFRSTSGVQMHVSDNLHDGKDTGWEMITGVFTRAEAPFKVEPVRTDQAEAAYQRILEEGGATLPRRDEVDRRIVETIEKREGGLIDSQDEVGGWPVLRSATPPADQDQDGMPDEWEIKHGLDPRDPSDAKHDLDRNGFTNLEEYLNGTDPRPIE